MLRYTDKTHVLHHMLRPPSQRIVRYAPLSILRASPGAVSLKCGDESAQRGKGHVL